MFSYELATKYIDQGLLASTYHQDIAGFDITLSVETSTFLYASVWNRMYVQAHIKGACVDFRCPLVFAFEVSDPDFEENPQSVWADLWGVAMTTLLTPAEMLREETNIVPPVQPFVALQYLCFAHVVGLRLNYLFEIYVYLLRNEAGVSRPLLNTIHSILAPYETFIIDTDQFFGFSFVSEEQLYNLGMISDHNGMYYTVDILDPLFLDMVVASRRHFCGGSIRPTTL